MGKGNFIKKIFSLSLIAMLIVALGPIYKAFSMGSNKDYTWKLHSYYDTEDLKDRILQDSEFIENWAYIAHILGFAWCGGTGGPHVGEDFVFEKGFENDNSDKVYYLKANYNNNDYYAKNHRADERLQMKISNVRLILEPTTLIVGVPRIIETKPITIASVVLENTSNEDNKISSSFTYTSNKSWSNGNNFKPNEIIGIKRKFTADIPLSKNKEPILSLEFGTEQGWQQSEGEIAITKIKSIKSYDKIQAKSKRQIDLIGVVKQVEIPYEVIMYIEYDMTLTGFLRGNGNGNAHVDHPTDRPTKSITFGGRSGMSATEDLLDMYNNRNIKGYSEWDWQWIFDNFGGWESTDYYIEEFCRVKRGGQIKGVFNVIEGTQIEIKASDPETINTMIKYEDFSKENKVEVKDFKYFKIPVFDVKGFTLNR